MSDSSSSRIQVFTPNNESELDGVRRLMRMFAARQRVNYKDRVWFIDTYFGDTYEVEICGLPGVYTGDTGHLLLATLDEQPAGCVGFRRLSDQSCEMKRLFVDPACRGHGVGAALVDAIVAAARQRGFHDMKLDTGVLQHKAMDIYRSRGFVEIEPFYDVPDDMRPLMHFFQLNLGNE